jgi:tRNA G37 N-methylase TrmD
MGFGINNKKGQVNIPQKVAVFNTSVDDFMTPTQSAKQASTPESQTLKQEKVKQEPQDKNCRLVAKNNKEGTAGSVIISAGCGQVNGDINLWTNGEKQAVLNSEGDFILLNGKLIDKSKEVSVLDYILNDGELPLIYLNYTYTKITLQGLNLQENHVATGVFASKLLNNDSWLNISVLSNTCVTVWFSELSNGRVNYNIKCLDDKCDTVHLYVQLI